MRRIPSLRSSMPSSRAPVPQSRTITVPSSIRSSTQDVLPPYFAVFGPGVGIEPLVPQNRTNIQQDGGSGAKTSQVIAGLNFLQYSLLHDPRGPLSSIRQPAVGNFYRP